MPADLRLARAITSLEGLSVGDSFGEQFFDVPDAAERRIAMRELPDAPWTFTDDTQMALSVLKTLLVHGRIDPGFLASDFFQNYDSTRGYGPSMHALLTAIGGSPANWQEISSGQMGGAGSFGNGAAMRSALIGAYFSDDIPSVVEQATLSSISTHTHPEAVAGAIAVAVAAAIASCCSTCPAPSPVEFLDMVREHVPDSIVKERFRHARNLDSSASVRHVVAVLGNGTGLSAQDTVPIAVLCAATYLDSYEEALWCAVECLGDRDTICAITGGIVACYTGVAGIPEQWRHSREPLPDWPFGE